MLTWQLTGVPLSGIEIHYLLEPLRVGQWPTNVQAWATYVDGLDAMGRTVFPVPAVDVIAPASPTPTVIPRATGTTTPTTTTTPMPEPSPISALAPRPAYLPLALYERCIPEVRHVDVALVIDASSSMDEPAAGGRSKLAVAVAAAHTFLDQINVDRGDQAAVVAFNASAHLLAPLTGNRPMLSAALGGIRTAQQTCIVCAVDTAWMELAGPRHAPGHAPVMVLLTDGQSNPRPVAEAVARAKQVKAAGVRIYTIGLGADVEGEALAAIASRPEGYYPAPNAGALAGIYHQIAAALPCPPEAFWGGR